MYLSIHINKFFLPQQDVFIHHYVNHVLNHNNCKDINIDGGESSIRLTPVGSDLLSDNCGHTLSQLCGVDNGRPSGKDNPDVSHISSPPKINDSDYIVQSRRLYSFIGLPSLRF